MEVGSQRKSMNKERVASGAETTVRTVLNVAIGVTGDLGADLLVERMKRPEFTD